MSDQSTNLSRSERKRAERRCALLGAAAQLIGERGVYGTRIEDITERADMAKGAFYTYFASKDALVAELLAEAVATLEAGYLGKLNGAVGAARIERVATLHDQFLTENPVYALLLHQTRGMLLLKATEDADPLRVSSRRYLDVLAGALVESRAPTTTQLEVAAVIAGAVAGAHTFSRAAGLAPSRAAPVVLAHGADAALKRKKRIQ